MDKHSLDIVLPLLHFYSETTRSCRQISKSSLLPLASEARRIGTQWLMERSDHRCAIPAAAAPVVPGMGLDGLRRRLPSPHNVCVRGGGGGGGWCAELVCMCAGCLGGRLNWTNPELGSPMLENPSLFGLREADDG